MNAITVDARLAARADLRFTPAGIPALDFQLAHESMQTEAGGERKVSCEIEAVAFAREATLLAAAKLGGGVKVTGFLAARSRTSKTVVLHATQVEFEQGD